MSAAAVTAAAACVEPLKETLAGWYGNYVQDHLDRLAVDLDIVKILDPKSEARILDIGSSPPLLLAALAGQGRKAKGLDIEPERFPASELGLDIRQCNIETDRLPFDDDSFDLLLLNEVFEHLRINPLKTCQELTRVLAHDGLLCVSTPNARSHRGLVNFVVRGRGGWCGAADIYAQYEKLESLGHMGHVREYTCKDIQSFLVHFELAPVSVIWRGSDQNRYLRIVDHVIPSASPFMSLVLRKA